MNFKQFYFSIYILPLVIGQACHASPERAQVHNQKDQENPVLVQVGSKAIRVQNLESERTKLDVFHQQRFVSAPRKKELLENVVRREVLLAEAYRLGLDQDPLVLRYIKRALMQELITQLKN